MLRLIIWQVSELGLVTTGGKVVWGEWLLHQLSVWMHAHWHLQGKYAQVTNNPEMDGCINSVRSANFI